jgi:menaquinone-specific isochorismate synthase
MTTTAPVPPLEAVPAAPAAPAVRLRCVRTVALPAGAADDLVALLPDSSGPLAWVRRGQGLVGWGEVARVHVGGPTRFADAHAAWRALLLGVRVEDEVRLPGTGPVAFASLAFADDSPSGGVLVVPEVVLGHRDGSWWLTTLTTTADPDAAPSRALPPRPERPPSPGAVAFADGALTGPAYVAAVAEAVERIQAGELEKVVLARDLRARTERPVDERWLLSRLAAAYPSCWSFAVDGLVGATPELLVRRERGLVHSRVLAGTIRRTGSVERDAGLAGSLARSGKDLEEHEYAVRSVVQALAPHCTTTAASEAPFVLHLPNVMHLATDVTGVLAPAAPGRDPSVLHLAAALHPTAAVCGTPTAAAARVIVELERADRDRFAGPVGWVDARGDGEMGLALRCARVDADDPRRVRLFAGAGVVAGSDPAAELAETEAKLVPVREALGG